MTAESDIKRYRDEAARIRTQISRTSSTIASKRKRAADARAAGGRSRSPSTIASKAREAEAAERDANLAEKKRAELEKKLADTEKRLFGAQAKYERELQANQKKALDAIRRETQAASRQFMPFERTADGTGSLTIGSAVTEAPEFDVFLSHASEDKDAIARPLKEALEARGLAVWFDEIQIKVGQSIRLEIEKGIRRARFGVVVLSPDFFAKQWTQAELDALFSRKMESGANLILPIWHRVTKDEVLAESPLLGGILALNTSLQTLDEIADGLAEVVSSSGKTEV